MRELDGIDTLIIDGRNLLWRMTHANAGLSVNTEEGEVFTGGIFGFIDVILSVLKRLPKNVDVIVAWEGSKRHRVYILPDYKLRKPDRKFEELSAHVNDAADWLKRILYVTGWRQATAPEWEADDVMGAVSLALNEIGENVAILSNDRDMFQCLRDSRGDQGWTRQIVPTKGVNSVWTPDTLRREWGVNPDQVILVKALAGDSSDCYKGAPGIGQVWACRIATEYKATHIKEIISKATADGKICESEKKARAILDNVEYVRACFTVAVVQTKIRVDLTDGISDEVALTKMFRTLKFRSLLSSRSAMKRIIS